MKVALPVSEDLFQENSIELRIQALTLVVNMPRSFVLQTLFSLVRNAPGVGRGLRPSYPSTTMHRDFLAVTLLMLTKADISAVYQQAILDNLADIWYVTPFIFMAEVQNCS